MNTKLLLHKKILSELIDLIEDAEQHESFLGDVDPRYCDEYENKVIEEYSVRLAGLMQVSFETKPVKKSNPVWDVVDRFKNFSPENNARVIGDIQVNQNGIANPILERLEK